MPATTRRRSTLSPVVLDVLPPPPPPPSQQQQQQLQQPRGRRLLKVVTLNCWGLLFPASRERRRRVEAIGRALMQWSLCSTPSSVSSTSATSSPPPDVVCLQEVWCAGDARSIASQAALGGHLVHSHHFENGAFGSGLLTLSAFPILEASFSAFAAAGDPLAVLQGDGVAGKGVGCVALDVSGLGAREGEEERRKAAKGQGRRGGRGGARRAAERDGDVGRGFSSSPASSEVLVVANTHLSAAYKDAHEMEEDGGETEAASAGLKSGSSGGGKASAASARRARRGASSSSSPSPRRPPPFSVPSDANGPVRLSQTIELAQSVRSFAAATGARRALLCGDLNSPPRSLEAALLRRLSSSSTSTSTSTSTAANAKAPSSGAPLGDAWAFLEEKVKAETAAAAAAAGAGAGAAAAAARDDPEDDEEDEEEEPPATPGRDRWRGATANRPLPEGGKKVATAGAGKRPARIDFVWSFSPPSSLLPESAEITMTRDAATGKRLSDHAGVEVVFELLPSGSELAGCEGEDDVGGEGEDGVGGEEEDGVGGEGEDGLLGPSSSSPSSSSPSLPLPLVDPLAASVPLIEDGASRARNSADAAGVASVGCSLAAAALAAATLLRLSSSSSSSSSSCPPSSSSSSLVVVALALALSFALGALSALLFALGYGGRHAFAAALGASARRARLRLEAEEEGRRRRPRRSQR